MMVENGDVRRSVCEEEKSTKFVPRPKASSCSFSIERILRKEEKATQQQHREYDEFNEDDDCGDSIRESQFYGKSPDLILTNSKHNDADIRRCVASDGPYRRPLCPIPTTPIAYADSWLSYYAQKGISSSNYCSMVAPSFHHKSLHSRGNSSGYSPWATGYLYPSDAYRRTRDSDISPSLGSFYKQSLIDDDKNDSKRKGGQVRFSHVQSVELERIFDHQKYISPQERKQLSLYLHLSERQVKTWFQNRRAKWRRVKMEAEMRRRLAQESVIRGRFDAQRESQSDLPLMTSSREYEAKRLAKEACIF
eukprot:gene5632-6328_t